MIVCGLFIFIFRIFDTKIQGLLHSIFLTVYRYSTGLSLKFEIWKYSTVPYRAKSLYCTCTVPCHTLVKTWKIGEISDRKKTRPDLFFFSPGYTQDSTLIWTDLLSQVRNVLEKLEMSLPKPFWSTSDTSSDFEPTIRR